MEVHAAVMGNQRRNPAFWRVCESTPEVQNVRQEIYRRAKVIWSVKKEKETVNPAWRVPDKRNASRYFLCQIMHRRQEGNEVNHETILYSGIRDGGTSG